MHITVRQPCASRASFIEKTSSSFMRSKFQRIDPLVPETSMQLKFLRPGATRVASNVPIAPPLNFARKQNASSTSTLAVLPRPTGRCL